MMNTLYVSKSFIGASVLILSMLGLAQAGPDIQHWTTDNGTRVYFVESHALPLLDIDTSFAAGHAYSPADRSGLAGMVRGLLATGVAGLDEEEIAGQIADTGAQFGGGTSDDAAGLTIRTLSSQDERNAAIALATKLLAHPTYPADALERERARHITGLRDALTRPGVLAERRFGSMAYGDHPYGRSASIESFSAITRDDLVDFHRRYYTSGNAVVTIVGDVTRSDAEEIALTLTRELPTGKPDTSLPQPTQPKRQAEHIPFPSEQAHILAGMPGMTRQDPDYYPLLLGNYILGGGGFVSRLNKEVREKRGFAYSIYSNIAPNLVEGPFQIALQTRGRQADEAMKVVEDILFRFITDGPTEEELKAARDNMINGFGLRLDSNRKILSYVSMIGFYQLPLNWLDTYTQQIAAVTTEQIRDAFSRHIKPEHLVIITAGGDNDKADKAQKTTPAAPGTSR